MRKTSAGCEGQYTLFDTVLPESAFPCSECVFDKNGHCGHTEGKDFYCVRGSFQVKPNQIICPDCGRKMDVVQSDFQSDFAKCKCGTVKIFSNRGNRPTALELYKCGGLVGV